MQGTAPATKDDIAQLETSVVKAHKRIDECVKDLSAMRGDVHEIKGAISPMSGDVRMIKEALIKASQNSSSSNSSNLELFKTIRWLLVAIVIGGMVAAGMTQFSASNGSGSVSVQK